MTKYIGPKTDGANVATQSDVGGSSLSDATPDALTPDQAGAAGTVNSAARADHAHEIICAAAGAILPDDVAAEGTASSFARSDHTHSISASAPGTITPDAAAAEGSSTSFARADHTHAIVAAAPGTITPDAVAAEGSSSSFARADHTHAIDAAAPSANLTASTTNTEGTSNSFSRADHSHAITTAAPGTINPDDVAAAGSSASLARADHTHAIVAAAPATNLTASTTNAEGNATSFARSNHTHAIDTAAPSANLTASTTNAVGTSANLARSDHSHAITTGSAGTITGSNATGSSASLARADHDHAFGSKSVPASALALGPTYETSLPGSPVDGQEIYYAANATDGVIWHLRYRSGSSSSYKWEFLGGSPLRDAVATDQNTSSTTYTGLTTAGPSVTVPLAGDYEVYIEGNMYAVGTTTNSMLMSYKIGATNASDDDAAEGMNAGSTRGVTHTSVRRHTSVAASTQFLAQYRAGSATQVNFRRRQMVVRPIRVG